MKPEDAIELPTTADLSDCSYEEARNLARRELISKGGSGRRRMPDCCITVSLWEIDAAIQIMAKFRSCDICAKMDYERDEWSLSMSTKESTAVVWSPGA